MNNINMKYLFTKPDGKFISTSTINWIGYNNLDKKDKDMLK